MSDRGKARVIFVLFGLIAMTLFFMILENIVFISILTVLSMLILYWLWSNKRRQKRINFLLEDCDPELFIERTLNQIDITGGHPASRSILTISLVTGYMQLGQYEKALENLNYIDKSNLSKVNGSYFSYVILNIICLYELGEITEAEKMYELEVPLLAPINKAMTRCIESLTAERLYYIERYKEARELLELSLDNETHKLGRMGTLYKLAVIDEELYDYDLAREKFKEISNSAPKLWVAKQSKLRLAKYE